MNSPIFWLVRIELSAILYAELMAQNVEIISESCQSWVNLKNHPPPIWGVNK